MSIFKKEVFAAEFEVGTNQKYLDFMKNLSSFIPITNNKLRPSDMLLSQITARIFVENHKKLREMHAYIPHNFLALKLGDGNNELYPNQEVGVPEYYRYNFHKNVVTTHLEGNPSRISDVLKSSTVKDAGNGTKMYEVSFLIAPITGKNKDCKNTDESPLMLALANMKTSNLEYKNIEHYIRMANGEVEILNRTNNKIIRRPEF